MFRSLRSQFLLPLAVLMVAFAGVCAWTAKSAADSAQARVAQQIDGVVRVLEEASFPLTPQVLVQMKNLTGGEFVLEEIRGARWGTVDGPIRALSDPINSQFGVIRSWGDRVEVHGQRYRRKIVVLAPPSPHAGARLFILYPESLWEGAVWQAVRPTLILGIAGGTTALCLMLLGTGGVSRRLRDLERRTRQIADGDFRPMDASRGPREIRRLADHINDMASKLQRMQDTVASLERERLLSQVTGGWAHQIRNAATGARLALQIHAQQCSSDGDSVKVAERQLSRIESDLKRFLDWRRGIAREELCPAVELIEEMLELVRPRCRHAGIALTWKRPHPPQPLLRGDRTQLTHLLLNVVNNAIEAAGPGGHVEIVLEHSGSRILIDVYDDGSGPPESIRDRLFEPFVTSKPEGIGLGLAFAAQVAQSHQGQISWIRTDDQRTRFRIELPLEKSE